MKKLISKATALLFAVMFSFVILSNELSIPKVNAGILNDDITMVSQLGVYSEGAKWTTSFSYTDAAGVSHTINAGETFARLVVNGHNACCIMLGTQVKSGSTYTPNGNLTQIWNYLSDVQKKYMGLVMAFGSPDTNSEYYYATQFLNWEITCGFRTCDENFNTNVSLINYADLSETGVNVSAVKARYNDIVNKIRAWYITPSSMLGSNESGTVPKYNMTFNPTTNKWEYVLSDTNNSLGSFNLTSSDSSFSISKASNKFVVSAPINTTGNCTVTANKIVPAYDSSIETEGLVIWHSEGRQALVSGAYFDPVSAQAQFAITGTAPITLTKEFYSGNNKITSGNISQYVNTASMADLFGAVRFSVTTEIDGKTYYVKKASGSNGSYAFGGFTADRTLFAVNTSTGKLDIQGLPKGYTYTIKEESTYSDNEVSFRLSGDRTVSLDGAYTGTVRNTSTPDVDTTSFFIEKDVLNYEGAVLSDTALDDYLNNAQFYLFTYNSASDANSDINRCYLQMVKITNNVYAGYITVNGLTTSYDSSRMTSDRSNATEIKLVGSDTVYFYSIPHFANGLYVEEVIGGEYAARFGALNTDSERTSENGAVFGLAGVGETLSADYVLTNHEKSFDAVAFKTDVNDNESVMGSEYIGGGEFGLYNSASKLIASASCVNGVVSYSNIPYEADESYYIQEITAPEGYAVNSEKFYLEFNGTAYAASLATKIVRISEKPIYGNLSIEKTDSTTGTVLSGASFTLKASEDIYIANEIAFAAGDTIKKMSLDSNGAFVIGAEDYTVTTDENGRAVFSYLPLGTYEIIETNVPENYVLNTASATVTLSEDEASKTLGYVNAQIPITNALQGGILQIYKTDGVTETPLEGAEFEVRAAEDFVIGGELVHAKDDVICALTTDENGYASNLLDAESVEVGEQTYYPMYVGAKYYITEIKAPEGYELDGTQEFFEFDYMGADLLYSEKELSLDNYETPTTTTTTTTTATTTTTTTTTALDSPPETGVDDGGMAVVLAVGILAVGAIVVCRKERNS